MIETRSELAVRRWSIVTDELLGSCVFSRWSGRNRRRSDYSLNETRRYVWLIPKLIE